MRLFVSNFRILKITGLTCPQLKQIHFIIRHHWTDFFRNLSRLSAMENRRKPGFFIILFRSFFFRWKITGSSHIYTIPYIDNLYFISFFSFFLSNSSLTNFICHKIFVLIVHYMCIQLLSSLTRRILSLSTLRWPSVLSPPTFRITFHICRKVIFDNIRDNLYHTILFGFFAFISFTCT